MDAHNNHQSAFLLGMKMTMAAAVLFIALLPALLR